MISIKSKQLDGRDSRADTDAAVIAIAVITPCVITQAVIRPCRSDRRMIFKDIRF